MKTNLCKCTKCGNILIDQNPQINANEYELTGIEIEMQYFQNLVENKAPELFWGCPVCGTDDYLIDI